MSLQGWKTWRIVSEYWRHLWDVCVEKDRDQYLFYYRSSTEKTTGGSRPASVLIQTLHRQNHRQNLVSRPASTLLQTLHRKKHRVKLVQKTWNHVPFHTVLSRDSRTGQVVTGGVCVCVCTNAFLYVYICVCWSVFLCILRLWECRCSDFMYTTSLYVYSGSQTFMFRSHPVPSCDSEGVKMHLHWQVEKTDETILPVDCRVFHECSRKFMSTLTSVQRHRVWMTTQSTSFISVFLRSYHSDAPVSPDKTCYHVMLPTKVLRTQVHMSRNSVQNHWHFLCLPVLDVVWNNTKIVPWSFPMGLFLWSTFWCSLLILRMSWSAPATTLNSWSSRLWSRNSSPPSSPNPHTRVEKPK